MPRSRRNEAELRIGTSGWHYAGWWGPFYPREVRKKDALDYYSTRFDSTELNAPFYRTPTDKAVETWFDTVPGDFRFAWKASKIHHALAPAQHRRAFDGAAGLTRETAAAKTRAGPVPAAAAHGGQP